jgi:hypothetical protein
VPAFTLEVAFGVRRSSRDSGHSPTMGRYRLLAYSGLNASSGSSAIGRVRPISFRVSGFALRRCSGGLRA